jgi:hypothetical protein
MELRETSRECRKRERGEEGEGAAYDNDDERHELEEVASAAHELLLLATRERLAVEQAPHNLPRKFEFGFQQFEAGPVPAGRIKSTRMNSASVGSEGVCVMMRNGFSGRQKRGKRQRAHARGLRQRAC